MRLFELSFLIVAALYTAWGLRGERRPRRLHWLPPLAVLLAIIHLGIEGYRWQMIPGYLGTAVLFLINLRRLQDRDPGPFPHARLQAALGLLFLAAAIALPILLPVPKLPPMTGSHAVGTNIVYLVDEKREEIYTEEAGDKRRVMAQIWYPAARTGEGETAVFLPQLDAAGPVLARQFDLPPFLFDHLNLSPLDIRKDVPVAGNGPFPVVIFSHGLSGIRAQNTSMMRELASHGYVVGAIDHTYGNAISVFPGGETILYDPCRLFADCDADYVEANPLVEQWAGDVAFLLDEMAAWTADPDHHFAGAFNLDRVGVFGHSTGGGATLQFCMEDSRCDAGLGLDAWVLPVDAAVLATPPSQPFMFISTPRWLGAENQAHGRAILEALPNDAYELTLAETGHYDFTDLVLISPLTPLLGLSGEIDSAYALEVETAYLLTFFDQYVRMEDNPFLDDPSPYPELRIVRYYKPKGN